MRNKGETRTIRTRLFITFSTVIAVTVIAIGLNIVSAAMLVSQDRSLRILYTNVEEGYEAQRLLRNLELAESAFTVRADTYYLNKANSYSAQLDTYIWKALLEAKDQDTRRALTAMATTKEQHQAAFADVVRAFDADDWDTVYGLAEVTAASLTEINHQLQAIIEMDYTVLAETDARQTTLQGAAFLISLISLAAFGVLAISTAIVVDTQVNRPIRDLERAALGVERGTFADRDLSRLCARSDEIGHLAQAFDTMADTVAARETALGEQVDQIRQRLNRQRGK